MRQIIVLTYLLLSSSLSFGQRLNTIYYGVSTDSVNSRHQIEFKKDGTLELSSFPRHMSQQFKLTFNYKRVGNTLEIYRANISSADSVALNNYGFKQYLNKIILTIEGKALTDNLNNSVYVLYEDFRKKCNLFYLIDGKVYKQQTGLPDSYGLINSRTKENKALKDKMDSMKDDLKNYDIKVYKGLDAYKKFGYESVFGVIELKRRM